MKGNYLIIKALFTVLATFQISYGQTNKLRSEINPALKNYINKPDKSLDWKDYKQSKTTEGNYYEINLTSQTWQEIPWRHRLIVYFPKHAKYPGNMMVNLMHGHLYVRDHALTSLKIISDSTGTPAAMLYDIPNQPLFNGKEEDDLQAFTFSQYIKTGDESWPLLFPMVKSVVRAMDVVQLLAPKESESAVNDFVVAGHSKRGHTTWLTAAIDNRVKGIIPIAIDILNSSVQLPHHLETFGEYSTPSKAAGDFLQELKQPRGQTLIQMVDPYTYRDQLTIPKLIVSANNDDFFTTDALNLYWDGLKAPKSVLYLPNANHVMAYSDSRINQTAFAFIRAIAGHKNLPALSWLYIKHKNSIVLKINADSTATKASLWTAVSKNKDFRQARWSSQPMETKNESEFHKEYLIEVPLPASGYLAIFGEIAFLQDGHTFRLSTQTKISSGKE